MKACISFQFADFQRAMLIVEHGDDADMGDFIKRIKKLPGVRNAAIIASHLQWAGVMPGNNITTVEEVKTLLEAIAEAEKRGIPKPC
jgi:hypothetical protein